jgi:hypothetical protein
VVLQGQNTAAPIGLIHGQEEYTDFHVRYPDGNIIGKISITRAVITVTAIRIFHVCFLNITNISV